MSLIPLHPAPTLLAGAVLLLSAGTAQAGQAFDAGSDGSDGALTFAPSGTPVTVDFDPAALAIDTDGDGVYHFTTVTIPENVTVRVLAPTVGWQPIYWLATGDITIDGALDLNGSTGHAPSSTIYNTPSIPGPGGYPGGVGIGSAQDSTVGFGPGGGQTSGASATHSSYGNIFLQPLTGGSGGAGGFVGTGSGGGAGGGAILLASNTAVRINGPVSVRGGDRQFGGNSAGGAGAGGGIRIAAPTITGSGALDAGSPSFNAAHYGRVRLESLSDQYTGAITARETRRVTLIPNLYSPPDPADTPRVAVTAVDGVAVPANPTGSFAMPDASINESGTITLDLEASGVPLGTEVTVYLFSENNLTQTVTSTPLAGTVESSSATATTTLPQGFTRGYPYAEWTP